MKEFQNGEESAFGVLFDRYTPRLINFAYRFLHSRGGAEDVIQETFVRIYKGKDRYDTERLFRPWVFAIASRLISNCLRDTKRHQEMALETNTICGEKKSLAEMLPDNSILMPLDLSEQNERSETVRHAVDGLPDKQRLALLLCRFEGMSYNDISHVMNTSVSAIESLLFRARQSLKRELSTQFAPTIKTPITLKNSILTLLTA